MLNSFIIKIRIRNINIETKNNNDMEANNLGSKKINGVQKNIDETKGKNISHDGKEDDANLKKKL